MILISLAEYFAAAEVVSIFAGGSRGHVGLFVSNPGSSDPATLRLRLRLRIIAKTKAFYFIGHPYTATEHGQENLHTHQSLSKWMV